MALTLPVPSGAYSIQEVTLAGKNYVFTYAYNERDSRWRLDISFQDTVVKLGIKIIENQALLARYRLENFDHGELFCLRRLDDGNPVGRDNFGIGKPYELIYVNNDELEIS